MTSDHIFHEVIFFSFFSLLLLHLHIFIVWCLTFIAIFLLYLSVSISLFPSSRFPGVAGVRRTGPLVRGGVLGGEDTRRTPLLGPGVLSGHLLRSTSRERFLPGTALLGQQVPTGSDGAGQDRLRHPTDARARRGVGVQPQLLPHLHQVGHTGQPGLAHAARAQGVPRILHQSFWLWQGVQPAEAERPRIHAAASHGLHGADKLCEGLGTMLHQTVHQQLPVLVGSHL